MGSIQPEDIEAPSYIIPQVQDNCRLVGSNADPACPNLLGACTRKDISPKMGTELRGLQLKDLTDVQTEELALFAAQRGAVFFRDQDWTDQEQVDLGAKMGQLEKHPKFKDGCPPAMTYPRAGPNSKDVPGEMFHSDMCEEEFPPSYTILQITETPPSGGDTIFANMYAAHDKLSPAVKQFFSDKTAINRRPPFSIKVGEPDRNSINAHPVIRTHPLTHWQTIFTNETFTAHLNETSIYESKALLAMLVQHVEKGVEFQIRFHWEPNSVAVWDNRAVQHIAVWDYYPHPRAGKRVAVFGAEKPYHDPLAGTQAEAYVRDDPTGKLPPNWGRFRALGSYGKKGYIKIGRGVEKSELPNGGVEVEEPKKEEVTQEGVKA